jgi:glycosyltransferase involved in cell wall biosynthesis
MPSTPRVSIGLPVYNGEDYLESAATSLLEQDFPDLELVLADNGSTDRTPQICAELARRDPRVVVHRSEQNRGAAWNYNRAFALSRGEYFKWAAHDDLYRPSFVSRCLEVLERRPEVVIAYTTAVDIDAAGRPVKEFAPHPYAEDPTASERIASLLGYSSSCFECFGLMRRKDLARTRLIGAYTSSDRALLFELALLGRFHEIPEPLFLHRQHPERGMARFKDPRQRNAWFDPTRAYKLTFPRWRLFAEYVGALARGPVPAAERARCLRPLASWALRGGGALLRELGGGARQASARLASAVAARR